MYRALTVAVALGDIARDHLYKGNPPDLLVRSAYLDVAGCRQTVLNPFFWPGGYDHAVADKQSLP